MNKYKHEIVICPHCRGELDPKCPYLLKDHTKEKVVRMCPITQKKCSKKCKWYIKKVPYRTGKYECCVLEAILRMISSLVD